MGRTARGFEGKGQEGDFIGGGQKGFYGKGQLRQ